MIMLNFPAEVPHGFEILFWFWTITTFIVGTCIGSFLNVCIWRIPRGESIVSPPSHCPKCNHKLAWFENFPIFGWLILGGKCRKCKLPISPQYILMEILTGLMFVGVWLKVYYTQQPIFTLFPYLIVTSLVITTFFIDLKHYIIPNETTYFTMIAGLIIAAVFPQFWDTTVWWRALLQSAISMSIGYLALGAFAKVGEWTFKKDALGWGDVKYIAAISAILGLNCAFFTVLIGSILGTIFGVGAMVLFKKSSKTVIPFGPYLVAATYIWILAGTEISNWYFSLIHR